MESKFIKSVVERKKAQQAEQHISAIAGTIFGLLIALTVWGAVLMDGRLADGWIGLFVVVMTLFSVYILFALKVASQWEKAVVLRLGKFHGLRGPGLFWIIPIIDAVPSWIDHRVMVTSFSAEKTLTKDTVPVDVDAVLFWVVWDAEKAALEVKDYQAAISWSAQTALRDIIGRMMLADILVGRTAIDEELQHIIDERTTPWGITVQSVEIRDVQIPPALQDAMSREAQAERERRARFILGTAETEIAEKFGQAALTYQHNPTALHLRAMNMLYEAIKEKGSMVIVPSSAVETMGLGGSLATAALNGRTA